ncbi:MAG: hypothetical protein EP302_10670 [Bacteroidetes bacterium]|nr:MAG: hypothetical protein EP302_10670 [Bacteroidota bacterium]
MIPGSETGRLGRLKLWIAGLTLVPALIILAAGNNHFALGYFTGGMLILLNLLGTERSVKVFMGGEGLGRILAILFYTGKLALAAAVVGIILIKKLASPVALMLGLSTLLAALIFDFFIFPIDKVDQRSVNGS